MNPRQRRRASGGAGFGTYLLWGGLAYLLLSRGTLGTLFGTPAGAATTGGFIPQPYSWWINPQTNALWLADASGVPPGPVPPWRLASDAEILAATPAQNPFTPPM